MKGDHAGPRPRVGQLRVDPRRYKAPPYYMLVLMWSTHHFEFFSERLYGEAHLPNVLTSRRFAKVDQHEKSSSVFCFSPNLDNSQFHERAFFVPRTTQNSELNSALKAEVP